MSFRYSPSEHIQQIRNDLRDRYSSGFPILKELLQNADDAGAEITGSAASQCVIVLCPTGLPEGEHALLKGAGLCLINDGDFTPGDANSINSYGLSNRGGQAGTAGKFGLGLKSIFHWAEAFFYFSPQTFESDGEEQSHPFDLQNPWFNRYTGKGLHRNWDAQWTETGDQAGTQKADFNAFKKFAGAVVGETRWFGLWIPFRTEEQTKDVPPIEKRFPKPDFHDLFGEGWFERVVEALPLLRRIRIVRFGVWRDGGLMEECSATLAAESSRISFGTASQVSPSFKCQSMRGTVKVSRNQDGGNEAGYVGLEQLSAALPIDEWINHKYWPSRFVEREGGGEEQMKEKAAPHGTSVFIRRRMRRDAAFKVQLAVFLPLGEPEVVDCAGEWNHTLFLHGFFFVDSGRTHIEEFANLPAHLTLGAVESESQIIQFWNRTLMEKVVAPLVLPSLDAFVRQEQMENAEAESMVSALHDSKTLKKLTDWMCHGQRFIHRLSVSGSQWVLEVCVAENGELPRWVELPALEFPETELFDLLPALPSLSDRASVSLKGKPSLADHKPNPLSDEELAELLGSVTVSGFHNARHLAYLLKLIPEDADQRGPNSPLTMSLVRLANQLVSHRLPEQEELSDLWRKFFKRFAAESFISLPCASTNVVPKIAQVLAEANLLVAVLWQDFRDAKCQGTLGWEALLPVLRGLGVLSLIDEPAIRQRSEIAARLLTACKSRPQNWGNSISDLLLFHARQSGGPARAVSVADLRTAYVEERLFTAGGSWAADFVKAAPEVKLLLVEKAVADLLILVASDCGAAACVKLLRNASRLADDFASRKPLFERLLGPVGKLSADAWAALRCLLHGDLSAWEQTDKLFREGLDNAVFVLLVRQALGVTGQPWRLIPSIVASQLALTPGQEQQLNLSVISAKNAEGLLKEVGPERVDCADLSREECGFLLLQFNDVDVLRGLNIHETIGSKSGRVRIKGHTYVDDGTFSDLPPEFDPLVTRIRPNPGYIRFATLELVPNLGWEAVIRIALKQAQPESYCQTILTGVGKLGTLRTGLKEEVFNARWLKMADGKAVAPSVLLHVPGAEAELDQLPPEVLAGRVPLQRLDQKVRAHDRFETFKHRVLPSAEDSLNAVAGLVQPHTAYSTGLSGEWSLDDTRNWVHTLSDVPAGTLPLSVLVKALYESKQVRDFVPAFMCQLGGTVSTVAYAVILKHLATGHEAAGAENRAAFNRVFVRYLRAIAEQSIGFARTVLKSNAVKLLTARGEWKSPAQMAFHTNGICEADTLCGEQAAALDLLRPQQPAQAAQAVPVGGRVEITPQSCAAVLQGYFANWAGVPRPLVGVFIGMLGGDRSVEQLAQSFLGVHALATFRELLCSFDGHPADLAEGIRRHHFRCSIVTGDRIHWSSIIGTSFEARRGAALTSLLVGSGPDAFVRTGNPFEISFRLIDPEGNRGATGVQTLQLLLQETTKQILTFVYYRRNFPLDQVWKKFAQTSQLHILIAQQFLLRNAIALLRQAGAGRSDHLKPILKRWDEANNLRAEERLSPELPQRAQILENKAIDALSRAFEDEQVHAEVLHSVRRTVERFRYDERSVAFELWQNADDAYVQLELLCSPQSDPRPASFVIVQKGSTLVFLHWGRPINQFRGEADFNGQDVGFDRDLQNMLTLNLSDKDNESGTPVTGKFGLGFKSVLLVSDAPKVLSGEVDFVVRGGLYPKPLLPRDRSRLENYLAEHTFDQTNIGTVFELPLALGQSPKPVLEQFLELLPVLLAFSRRIKRFVMSGSNEPSSCWSESALQGNEGIGFGLLASPLAGADRALLMREEQTTLLLGMNALGFIPLPESVPVFWVTAPTRDTLGYGFAVNGPFEPDAGRVQLAGDSEKNRNVAEELSRVIAERLRSLWDMARRDWDALRQQLQLSPSVNPNMFWGSLWNLVGVRFGGRCPRNDTSDLAELARTILWKSDATGLRDFYTHRAALPTGLWGDHSGLTHLGALRFRAAGVLDDERVFNCIVEWPRFKQQVPVGAICSNGKVARHLGALGAAPQQCQEIHLCEVVAWELGSEMLVDSAKAAQLGVLITPEFKKRLTIGTPTERTEAASLEELLRAVQFQAADGSWHRSGELLVVQPSETSEDGGDEAKRAAFAPAEHRLHPAYTEKGLEFFLAARGRIAKPSPEKMAKWALTASTSKQRKAVLQYLLAGSEATRHLLARQLRNMRTDENWLSQLDDADTEAAGLNAEEQSELSCFVLRTRKPEDGSPLVVPPVPTTPRPVWTPAQLWKWWGEGKRSAAHEYILEGDNWQLLYPSTEEPDEARRKQTVRKNLLDADSEQGRRTWYRLFGLACLMSEVRRTSEMREFWRSELEGNEAFWEVTSKPMFGDGADKVFDGLFRREFAHVHARYERAYFWRRVFYDIRKIHRLVWDSGFPAIILARAETVNSGRELIEFLRSGHIPNQEKWVGVVGQSIGAPLFFVIRELRRLGVIKNATVDSAAFFPCRPVRRAAASIGWLSDDDVQAWEIGHLATISETLHRRISGDAQYVSKLLSDYDIPLLHMGVACRPLPPPLPVL